MADIITFRIDDDVVRALAVLTRDGTSVSSAVRAALIDAARERASLALRAEAEELAADGRDRAEAAQVLLDMEPLRACPGHQVTETPALAHGLDVAARRWPQEPRSKSLLRLTRVGQTTLEDAQREISRRRLDALETSSGRYSDAFGSGHLAELRTDWPE